jgi:hypothetical protein
MAPAALIRRTPIIVGLLAVASALARNREVAAAIGEAGHAIVSEGCREALQGPSGQ